jgi:phage head maturation protease
MDEHGLAVRDASVTDDETWARIADGSLRGMSIGALVRKATCGICGGSFFDCPHLGNQSYDGKPCTVTLEELDLGEVSLVENPANPMARVERLGTDEPGADQQARPGERS